MTASDRVKVVKPGATYVGQQGFTLSVGQGGCPNQAG